MLRRAQYGPIPRERNVDFDATPTRMSGQIHNIWNQPYQDGKLPKPRRNCVWMIRQDIGPPKFKLPWYSEKPYGGPLGEGGRVVTPGGFAGDLWGPVEELAATPRDLSRGYGKIAGFTSAKFKHPMYGLDETVPEYVWVNLWCSDGRGKVARRRTAGCAV